MSDTARGDARNRVVVLASPCTATNVVTNALRAEGIDAALVVERPVSGWRLAKRRAKRLGVPTVAGQVLFRLAAVPVLERRARSRITEILAASSLDAEHVDPMVQVASVNDPAAREVLATLDPSVVVVVGTRIISRATLGCVHAPFVNLHAGITPRYRGVHGAYWALVEGRPDLVGSTVHLVDAGIDTGTVLRQATFQVTDRDSFATYPLLHLAVGVPQLVEVVEDVLAGKPLVGQPPLACGDSRLWHHPTLWGYLSTRRRQHVA
jgi:methionyl-tRNA formyltransferase